MAETQTSVDNACDTSCECTNGVTVVGSYIVALVMDVDRIPLEGETLVGRNLHTTHGGKGSIMAVCASRLGASTRFFGKIGRDNYGARFLELLDEESVDNSAVLTSENLPTAVGFIVFSKKGANVIGWAALARLWAGPFSFARSSCRQYWGILRGEWSLTLPVARKQLNLGLMAVLLPVVIFGAGSAWR